MQGKALGHVGPCAACTSAALIARRFELVVEEDTVLEGYKKDAYNRCNPHCLSGPGARHRPYFSAALSWWLRRAPTWKKVKNTNSAAVAVPTKPHGKGSALRKG